MQLLLSSVFINDRFSKPVRADRSERAVYRIIEKILKEVGYCEDIMIKKLKNKIFRKLEEILKQLINVMHILGYISNEISE